MSIEEDKIDLKNKEIVELWELLRKQREINAELRKENIRLINEKVKARAAHV